MMPRVGAGSRTPGKTQELTLEEIAEARKSSVRTVYRLMKDDNEAVAKIAKNLVAQKPKRAGARVS